MWNEVRMPIAILRISRGNNGWRRRTRKQDTSRWEAESKVEELFIV
jgi:hypothetical protein